MESHPVESHPAAESHPATHPILDPATAAARVVAIEVAALHSWPALHTQQVDGWWLRAERGITGRANSVWSVRSEGRCSLDERVAAAEAFYARHGLPSRFLMTPAAPEGLADLLAARGYRADSYTWVQTARLADILQRTPGLQSTPHLSLEVAESFDGSWFALYREAEQARGPAAEVREAILRRIAAPVAFAQAQLRGEAAAVGLGVVHGAWLGIFCMSTRPDARRQGAATAILRTLAIWAGLYGATDAYLQVRQENSAAQATYARAGFANEYPYYYSVQQG